MAAQFGAALLSLKRFDDPNETRINRGNLSLEAVNRRFRFQCPDHSPACGALQNRHRTLLSEWRDKGALKSVPLAFWAGGNRHAGLTADETFVARTSEASKAEEWSLRAAWAKAIRDDP